MKTIAAFSKYLSYTLGGAEASTLALLDEEAKRGCSIRIICVGNAKFRGRRPLTTALPPDWQRNTLTDCVQFPRFTYFEYVLNRARLRRWFERLRTDELWAYGTWAPAAIAGYSGPVRYFVRSETDLGIVGNYHNGARRWFKHAYDFSEFPAISIYRQDLMRIASRPQTRIIANSVYMAKRTVARLGVEAEVSLPRVNIEGIRERLRLTQESPRWIVFVGDSVHKGLNIACELAKLAPDLNFRFFSRAVREPHVAGNVQWLPWQTESWRVYSGAALVIVPSQWEEAYGRTAREAHLLGLPVLVSNVGGLPEAVDNNADRIVEDHRNSSAWLKAIRRTSLR